MRPRIKRQTRRRNGSPGGESGGFGFQSSILRYERIDLFCQFLRGANIEHRDAMAHCQDIWDGGILALTAQPLLNPYFALACKNFVLVRAP
jgi:hypothetical protein